MSHQTVIDCENLNELGVRRRRTLGFIGLAGALFLVIGLAGVNAPAAAYLLVALPAWAAALGLLQAKRRTCVRLAAMGVKETPDGSAVRVEGEELAEVRRRAARITRTALVIAAASGVAAMVVATLLRGLTISAS